MILILYVGSQIYGHLLKMIYLLFFPVHGEGRLTNSDLFRTYQPILIEFTMVVYEKIYLAA